MMDKFWESLGGDLAGEWLRRAFSPPFLFYLTGLGCYILRHGWRPLWQRLLRLDTVTQIALLVLALLVLVLSSLLTARWRFAFLRWMEGYWPWPLRYLEGAFTTRQQQRLEERERRLNALLNQRAPTEAGQTRQRAELETFVHYHPADPAEFRPTRLGNILRAGETAPAQKYGLDAHVCWPRLWPLLPEAFREDIHQAYTRLLTMAEIWGMGLLSLVWVVWSWWALPLALLWMGIAYRLALPVAMAYADLVESAFDLYRFALYEALHWEPPADSDAEVARGRQLTEFLWRGTLPETVRYKP